MADLALAAAQTLFAALDCSVLKDVCSMWGYKSEFEGLKETVSTIEKVLLDAEAQRQLSHQSQRYIEQLKDAVYDADDLFDEVRTLAQLKQMGVKGDDHKISEKVRDFFSSKKNPLSNAYKMSKKVKKIKLRLESIASDHAKFGFRFDAKPILERKEETCSYVYAPHVIGREDDTKAVVDRLLVHDDAISQDVDFLTIVGIGGLGKTTLAQLVYDDQRIKNEFSMRLWVCVSDQDGVTFDVKSILSKILKSAGHEPATDSTKEQLKNQFLDKLSGKKCFVILDDVWNEKRDEWIDLKHFLMSFSRGSRVLVTTRSEETARVIGDGHSRTHLLEGLSKEKSWSLFGLAAFGKESDDAIATTPEDGELVTIGRKIVEQCCGVPLALKVVGSLLFGQKFSKWQAFEKMGLANNNICQGDNKILSILKLSYDNLEPSLKSCFGYCALFPKDYAINKQFLINLWMAQGYIKTLYGGQSLEEAGEEHFCILMRRCFFQNLRRDDYGDVVSFKIHDLMHDVAKQVTANEICAANPGINNSDAHKIRHIFKGRQDLEKEGNYSKGKIRSYLQIDRFSFYIERSRVMLNINDFVCLRSLSMNHAPIEELPDSIGKLLHLRYLSLFGCMELRKLPNSITKLFNLQTLILTSCKNLKELPKQFCKLINLMRLDIGDSALKYIPTGLDQLTCLTFLSGFFVGDQSENQCVSRLRDLKALRNLKGNIDITFEKIFDHGGNDDDLEGGYVVKMEQLKGLRIYFRSDKEHEALIGNLQPHPNLRELVLNMYMGATISRWGRSQDNWVSVLPNLIQITLFGCERLRNLPVLSQLQHLRSLQLFNMGNLKYFDERDSMTIVGGNSLATTPSSSELIPFFPSLQVLKLDTMPELRGWWKKTSASFVDDDDDSWQHPSFPRLITLRIKDCPNLISFPSCPTVEIVNLQDLNEKLNLMTVSRKSASVSSMLKLREVETNHVSNLKALPACHPTHIRIYHVEVKHFSGEEEIFKARGSSSVKNLNIQHCPNLNTLSGGGFQHLTALESLVLFDCPKLVLNDDDDGNGIPWRSFQHTLRSMRIIYFGRSSYNLPRGMQHLTSLQHLQIRGCESLPEWIDCLSSLQSLFIAPSQNMKSIPEAMRSLRSLLRFEVQNCSKDLEDRCQAPNGNDWPKIQHIPHFFIRSKRA